MTAMFRNCNRLRIIPLRLPVRLLEGISAYLPRPSMVTSYNNSIAALYEQAQHHANHHPHQGHDRQEDEVEVTTAVKPQPKASASYKPKPGPSPHHLLLVVRRVNAFPRIYSWWSWKKAPWLVYAWLSSCFSSCVRVDVFLDLGPDLDLVGITSSSSVDLTCADLTDEAGADSAGDLSRDHT